MRAAVLVAIVLALVGSAAALNCVSSAETFIGNTNSDSVACTSSTDKCMKTVTYLGGEVLAVARSCSSFCSANSAVVFGNGIETFCCSTDNCNSASLASPVFALVSFAVAGAIAFLSL